MVPAELTDLLARGPAILGASRSDDLVPQAFRAWGAAVDSDGRLRVVVGDDGGGALDDLAANGAVAVTVTDVRTFRSLQLKGRVIGPVAMPDRDDIALMRAYVAAFGEATVAIGHRRDLVERMRPYSVAVVRMEVDQAFDQTPGPGAGSPVPTGRAVGP